MEEHNIKRHNLQELKQELLSFKEYMSPITSENNNEELKDIFGLFGNDNSFVFVKQNQRRASKYDASIFSIFEYVANMIFDDAKIIEKYYYLKDVFTNTPLSDLYDEEFEDGETYDYNDVDYYVISLSKILPATYFLDKNNINMAFMQDKINEFLCNNPNFVEQVFFSKTKDQDSEDDCLVRRLIK